MSVPIEFTSEYVEENSPVEEQLYGAFLNSGEPYRSMARPDFHTSARLGFSHDPRSVQNGPTPGLDLEDDGLYYNTTGSAAEYWKDRGLPTPTKDLKTLRSDLKQWGYCLIEEGLSSEQTRRMHKRLADQAEGERMAGVACWSGTPAPPGQPLCNSQMLHCLINKGKQFIQCVEHDPQGVQAGPMIEQLITGARAFGFGGIEGAWEDDFLVNQRLALERGEYVRIPELSPDSTLEALSQPFTYRDADSARRREPHQPMVLPEIKIRFADRRPGWQAPAREK